MTPAPRETFRFIEAQLEEIMIERSIAESEGDSEALKQIDIVLMQYLQKEAVKIDSYAGLIHQRQDDAEACEREAGRLLARAQRFRNDVDRLKATALSVMQQYGVKELKTATNAFRRQVKPGLQTLDVPNVKLVPDEFLDVTVKMPRKLWDAVSDEVEAQQRPGQKFTLSDDTPDKNAIRTRLAQRVSCPECEGMGRRTEMLEGAVTECHATVECPHCEGKGTIPATVPGARLLERGEHVRVV